MGIKKLSNDNLTFATHCTSSYGLLLEPEYLRPGFRFSHDAYMDSVAVPASAEQELMWLIRRGDLLLSGQHKEVIQHLSFHFQESYGRKRKVPVFEYADDDVPTFYETAESGKSALPIMLFYGLLTRE